MLSHLSIKNYALIDAVDIHFDRGLNILTGETGAGKSIIMGGLSLILGQRAESKYFFNQEKKCIIEGYFDISAYDLKGFFDEQDLDYEKETILRREISHDGKSRAFVNDSPVTLNILKALGERLIDIHSQHATLQVSTTAFQLMVLDSVAQNKQLLGEYTKSFTRYREISAALGQLKEAQQKSDAESDYHQFLFDELSNARLQPGEQAQLEAEQDQLEHAEEIKRGLLGSTTLLEDGEYNTISLLKDALQQVQQAERFMPSLASLAERLQSGLIELKDISSELSRAEQDILLDEGRLIEVNERLSQLYSLQQKHRVDDVHALIGLRDELERKLTDASSQEAEILRLESALEAIRKRSLELANQLSQRRVQVIPAIQSKIGSILSEVGMPESRLEIELSHLTDHQLKPSGQDEVSFLFSANKGQMPKPIGKVASGGELSRLMLAIKSVVARSSALPTIIFDEIDTGISGEVSIKVGEIMEQLAGNMQVIAITHLPQIASKGATHFKVYKTAEGSKTTTNIAKLDGEERVQEIAQMLSGANPGETALLHAAELLK